ncbi:hypothetical protein LB524_01665 [Mesorhizobium sp. ESP6-5]|uniref:hypothetical protein n=1 Tax=Mesorhizobium sp. ESP6-5 TaxID=2876623 RepID=UPI001CCD748D|nr:hypothetical protein [Mesorhizobium sp. ESP6-5]MBZ9753981.1 hypothetical protein [Mesorhizobium sp. ESP6-5]
MKRKEQALCLHGYNGLKPIRCVLFQMRALRAFDCVGRIFTGGNPKWLLVVSSGGPHDAALF